MTFRAYRRSARLRRALDGLAESEAIANVAHAVGYSSLRGFGAAIKAGTGAAPSRGTYPTYIRSATRLAPGV